MDTIANLKEQAVTETPLILLEVLLSDGEVHRWCTHGVTVDGQAYSARVLHHNLFEMQMASDHGIDAIPKIAFTAANADSLLSQIESSVGFKGARITATFLFGYSGFVVGNPRPSGLRSLSLPWNDSRSVLAVKGPLRRAEGAPLTAPLRSKPHI